MSWRSRRQTQDALTVVGAGLLIVLIVGSIIWWHLNYRCVSEHYEWRTDCTVHRNSDGKRTGETCHEHRVEVCDQWEER